MYISSITTKYGDLDQVKNDVRILNEILARQGASLLIDCIANQAGEAAIKYKFNDLDRINVMDSLVTELKESLEERI